ncbi:hypothetical protein [Butyricicoccus sp.]|uniref:hypothetical protein n=1 Tax=Butyricicoccus sp. TaxID=2049021 RepID=UPI003D7DCE24
MNDWNEREYTALGTAILGLLGLVAVRNVFRDGKYLIKAVVFRYLPMAGLLVVLKKKWEAYHG